jgi:hypothetical protein
MFVLASKLARIRRALLLGVADGGGVGDGLLLAPKSLLCSFLTPSCSAVHPRIITLHRLHFAKRGKQAVNLAFLF